MYSLKNEHYSVLVLNSVYSRFLTSKLLTSSYFTVHLVVISVFKYMMPNIGSGLFDVITLIGISGF